MCRISYKDVINRNLFVANLLPSLAQIEQFVECTNESVQNSKVAADRIDDEDTYISQQENRLEYNRSEEFVATNVIRSRRGDSPYVTDVESQVTKISSDDEATYIPSQDFPFKSCNQVACTVTVLNRTANSESIDDGADTELQTPWKSGTVGLESLASWGKEV
jgi:hypothetical protein